MIATSGGDLDRTPPKAVRMALRKEVGFGCPVPDCGNPYLEWHHFDPPWHARHHHDPVGMIALCSRHHPIADRGAYTTEQLREFKQAGSRGRLHVGEHLEWMRRRLLLVAGGNFFYESYTILSYKGRTYIHLSRDENGYLLISIEMMTIQKEPRARIEDNFWITHGDLEDVDCPPSGKLVHLSYPGGDELRMEFFDDATADTLKKKYPGVNFKKSDIQFPIAVAEVQMKVGGTDIAFGPLWAKLPGIVFQGSFFTHCSSAAIAL